MTVVGDPSQKSLTREQKESIGLLQIGTFLEYFDFFIFTHDLFVVFY